MIETVAPKNETEADAFRLIERQGHPVGEIIAVCSDSVLFRNSQGAVRTAWVYRDPERGKVRICVVHGFAAMPPADWPHPVDPADLLSAPERG